jgi:hypothetical protein
VGLFMFLDSIAAHDVSLERGKTDGEGEV